MSPSAEGITPADRSVEAREASKHAENLRLLAKWAYSQDRKATIYLYAVQAADFIERALSLPPATDKAPSLVEGDEVERVARAIAVEIDRQSRVGKWVGKDLFVPDSGPIDARNLARAAIAARSAPAQTQSGREGNS